MTPEPCCEFSTGVCRIDKEYEMTFEKWWSDHKYHIGLTSMVDCKAAYLAGQASAEERVKELEQERDEWKHLVKEVDKQLRTEIGALQAKCAELTRERDGWVEYADRRNTAAIVAESQLVTLKAQAGEPVAWQHRQRGLKEYEWQEWQTVGYKPQGPESQTFQMRPLFTHPTTERPYNPLNDYAVIPMNPTEPVKAQAGEPVGYHFSYTTPFGHVVWAIDYTPRPDAIEVYPLVRAHSTTERRVPPQVIYDTQTGEIKPLVSQERIEELERELEFAKLILAERGLLGLMTP